MPKATTEPEEGFPYGRLANGQPRKVPFVGRGGPGVRAGANRCKKFPEGWRRFKKNVLNDEEMVKEIQEFANKRDAQKQEAHELAERPNRVASNEHARTFIGPRTRALGIATGFRDAECRWNERVEFLIGVARDTSQTIEARNTAWDKLERLAKEASNDIMAASMSKNTVKPWQKMVERAVAKNIMDGDMDAAKMAVDAGQVEGWSPTNTPVLPTTAVQINVHGDISPDKKARLDELDLLIQKPLNAIPAASDARYGDIPDEIIVEAPESPKPEEPPDVEPAESED